MLQSCFVAMARQAVQGSIRGALLVPRCYAHLTAPRGLWAIGSRQCALVPIILGLGHFALRYGTRLSNGRSRFSTLLVLSRAEVWLSYALHEV